MSKLLAVLALITISMLVGGTATQAVTFNPQVGVNISALDTDPVNAEHSARAGFQVGGYLRFDVKKFYIEPGIFWHFVGTKLETKNEITQETNLYHHSVHSIQIPVMAAYNIINGETFDLRLQAGTAIDIITSVDANNYFTKDDLSSTYWSFKFAVGADFWILSADLGYDLGMSNYFTDEHARNGKMSGWFLNAGVRF